MTSNDRAAVPAQRQLDALGDADGALADELYRRLRATILDCGLPPDTVISQVRLARQFGISRTPLREVLRLLERDRLVVSERNRRVRIMGFSVADLDEVYAARIAVEPLAARLSVASVSPAAREELAERHAEMARDVGRGDFGAWQAAHRAFHDLLTAGAPPRIKDMVAQLADHADRYRRIYTTTGAVPWGVDSHDDVLDLALAADRDGLSQALARHIARAGLMAVAAADPGYEAVLIRESLRLVVPAEPATPARRRPARPTA